MIRMRATPGLRIEDTEKLTTRVEDFVRNTIPEKERQMVIANIGVLYDWPAAYTPNSGSQDAFILIQLSRHRQKSSFDYVDELRRKLPPEFPGTEFNFDTGGLLTSPRPFRALLMSGLSSGSMLPKSKWMWTVSKPRNSASCRKPSLRTS